ncbi:hypothetical protein IM40_09465 (plasmid) [Candidatus Paracaedimonas acanthamoebae]|nr:hypothetical protein IM40_09465 [Candidatus Paracaedimonas acanthamoebae]
MVYTSDISKRVLLAVLLTSVSLSSSNIAKSSSYESTSSISSHSDHSDSDYEPEILTQPMDKPNGNKIARVETTEEYIQDLLGNPTTHHRQEIKRAATAANANLNEKTIRPLLLALATAAENFYANASRANSNHGNYKHKFCHDVLEALKGPFLNLVNIGAEELDGNTRVDIIWKDSANQTVHIFDYKFGGAKLSNTQEEKYKKQYEKTFGSNTKVIVKEIRSEDL